MNKKIIRRLILLFIFLFVYIFFSDASITSDSSFKAREISANYGPSEVVHIEKIGNNKLYLSKYDKWFSCVRIKRRIGLWFYDHFEQIENNLTKDMNYGITSFDGKTKTSIYYGIVNNKKIEKVEFTFEKAVPNKHVEKIVSELHDGMFLFSLEDPYDTGKLDYLVTGKDYTTIRALSLKGIDKDGNVIDEIVVGENYLFKPTEYTYIEPSGNFYIDANYSFVKHYNEDNEPYYIGRESVSINLVNIEKEYENPRVSITFPNNSRFGTSPSKLGKGTSRYSINYEKPIFIKDEELLDVDKYINGEISISIKWVNGETEFTIPKDNVVIEIKEASQ